MLYIGYIRLDFDNFDVLEPPCVYYCEDFRKRGNLVVRILDTDSDWTHEVYSMHRAWGEFEEELARFNPYGYVPKCLELGRQNSVLVVIDELSLKFLEYVESIEPVRPSSDMRLLRFLRSLQIDFMFCDDMKSLADVNPHAWRTLAFPLFQCLCFSGEGWYGDNIYINTVWDKKVSWHKVVFNDVTKVRSLFAKAAIQGYDPIRANISVINRL